MRFKANIRYPSTVTFLHAICAVTLAMTETGRVQVSYGFYLLALKALTGLVSFVFAIRYVHRPPSDRACFLLFANLVVYCLVSMWMLPLYEFAYFECAIACAFFRTQRAWIFPAVFGAGVVGFLVSYRLQDLWGIQIPAPMRMDYILGMLIIFLVSVLIQQFALRASEREDDRRQRYSLIGRETTRLVHDLKGLLSAPLMLIDHLQEHSLGDSPADIQNLRATIRNLGEDMRHVRGVLKQVNRLVVVNDDQSLVDVALLLRAAAQILDRRLRTVRVTFPESRTLFVYPERLHSVFFNLLLNSVEAFETRKIDDAFISITWLGEALVIEDNAGGLSLENRALSSKKDAGGGLGLEIVRTELERMRIGFELANTATGLRATLYFSDGRAAKS